MVSEEFRMLCEETKELKNKIAHLEGELVVVDNDYCNFNNSYEFHCFHCSSIVPYAKRYIETMKNDFGATWWTCPVCGCKVYFEEVYCEALRRKKAPKAALP